MPQLTTMFPEDFRGMDRYEVRKKVVARFEEYGLIEKIEDYQNKVGYSERGGVPIEPYLSEQWFMKMDDLSKPALQVVNEGKIKFYPDHWVKTYDHWMNNITDWCILAAALVGTSNSGLVLCWR